MTFLSRWWLTRKLASTNHAVRLSAAIGLAQSGDARAIQPLAGTLATGDAYSSRKAAEALGLIKEVSVVKPLMEALSHREPSTRRAAQEALVRLGNLSMGTLSEAFLSSARSVPVDKLAYGPADNPAKCYAPTLEAMSWKPTDPHQRILLALALGKVPSAAEEGAAAFESLSALLNHTSVDIRERAALSLSSRRATLPSALSAAVEATVNGRNERQSQELRQKIEGLKSDELMCLSCKSVQQKGAWEKQMDDQSKAAGMRGFVNINSKAKCVQCNSDDMAGPRWDGYLFREDRIAYYDKLRKLGVKASWMREG